MVSVSTQTLSNASRQTIAQTQTDLANAQAELSSGKLADIGLGLGARSSTLISLDGESARLQAITTGNTTATTRLSATVSALNTMQSTAQSFLSSLLTADPASPATMAVTQTGQGNLSALISTLNTTVAGQYIFGGINTGQQPVAGYTTSPASATKSAVDTSFASTFGFSQSSTDASTISATDMQSYLDGAFASQFTPSAFSATWSSASDQVQTSEIAPGETVDSSVSANASPFAKLSQAYAMVSEFTSSNFSAPAVQAVITTAQGLVNSAITDLTNVNVGVGIAQSSITDANSRMSTQMSLLSSSSDSMIGVDAATLTTRLSTLQTQITASYELTAKLQDLSLTNYLK